MADTKADLILHHGKIATQDDRRSVIEAVAIRGGRFLAVGTDREIMQCRRAECDHGHGEARCG